MGMVLQKCIFHSFYFQIMNRVAYKYRIYPNNKQKEYFAKCFGCVRFFYNKSLEDMNKIYEETKEFKNITPASYKNEFPFLKEVDSLALCNAQLNRNTAFKAFFKGYNKFPKFKSKKNDQSFTTNNLHGMIHLSDNDRYISINKCKRIRIKKHRDFAGAIKSATISKTCDDRYYISLVVETEIKPLEKVNKTIGLDIGVKDIIITSDGVKYKNNKYLAKSEKKLSKEQRKLSHMVCGSNNHNKQRIKVARIYKHITNQRNDYLHKLSRHIIDENQIICVEDLKIKDMTKGNLFGKELTDTCMSRLLFMLSYKASWYGRTLIKVPTDYPSSQLCSSCGYKNSITKNLNIRKWTCPSCGSIHDRDINAAKNILRKGIEILSKDGTHPDSLRNLEPLGSLNRKPPLL